MLDRIDMLKDILKESFDRCGRGVLPGLCRVFVCSEQNCGQRERSVLDQIKTAQRPHQIENSVLPAEFTYYSLTYR